MLKIYLKNLLRIVYRKWVKRECRHLCYWCKHYSKCLYEMGMNYDYTKGFDDGYNTAIENAKFVYKRGEKNDL